MATGTHPYARIVSELRGTRVSDIRYVEETASTNRDAAELLGDEKSLGATIIAERQTDGAGRKGRSWIAKEGTSLLLTTILPRSIPATHLWIVPFGVAICVRRALQMHGITADLHWPNDLLVQGKKIAGILCVSRVVADRAWVGAGVGINVHRDDTVASTIAPPPAYCDDFVREIDRVDLLRDLLLQYDLWEQQLDMPPRIARVWERQAGLPGMPYRILKDGNEEPIDVTAIGLANGGGLVVTHGDGSRETISLADARALR